MGSCQILSRHSCSEWSGRSSCLPLSIEHTYSNTVAGMNRLCLCVQCVCVWRVCVCMVCVSVCVCTVCVCVFNALLCRSSSRGSVGGVCDHPSGQERMLSSSPSIPHGHKEPPDSVCFCVYVCVCVCVRGVCGCVADCLYLLCETLC